MQKIFGLEPYEKASQAFLREYVRDLARRCGGDQKEMAGRSGLSPEAIAAAMKDPEQTVDPIRRDE